MACDAARAAMTLHESTTTRKRRCKTAYQAQRTKGTSLRPTMRAIAKGSGKVNYKASLRYKLGCWWDRVPIDRLRENDKILLWAKVVNGTGLDGVASLDRSDRASSPPGHKESSQDDSHLYSFKGALALREPEVPLQHPEPATSKRGRSLVRKQLVYRSASIPARYEQQAENAALRAVSPTRLPDIGQLSPLHQSKHVHTSIGLDKMLSGPNIPSTIARKPIHSAPRARSSSVGSYKASLHSSRVPLKRTLSTGSWASARSIQRKAATLRLDIDDPGQVQFLATTGGQETDSFTRAVHPNPRKVYSQEAMRSKLALNSMGFVDSTPDPTLRIVHRSNSTANCMATTKISLISRRPMFVPLFINHEPSRLIILPSAFPSLIAYN